MIRWILGKLLPDDPKVQPIGENPQYDPNLRRALRKVLLHSDDGEALTYILIDLGVFDPARTQRDGVPLAGEDAIRANALRDWGLRLLEMLGVLHEGHIQEVIKHMKKLPVWEKEEPEEDT